MKKNSLNIFQIVLIVTIGLIPIVYFFKSNYFLTRYYNYSGYLKNENYIESIKDFTKSLEYDDGNIAAYISRGSAYLNIDKFINAISDYTNAIKYNPNDPRPYAYRGRAFYQLKNYEAALIDYNMAIKLNDKFEYAYYNRGLMKFTVMKQKENGCEDLNKALSLGSVDAKYLLRDGSCK